MTTVQGSDIDHREVLLEAGHGAHEIHAPRQPWTIAVGIPTGSWQTPYLWSDTNPWII